MPVAQVALYRVKAKFWKTLVWLTLGGVLFISIVFSFFSLPSIPTGLSNRIPATVWTYQDVVEAELKTYKLEDYTSLILALITVESGGVGGDIMQASESQGLPPNTITDPLYSIEVGIAYFASLIEEMAEKEVDIATVLQSYNFGTAYINHVAENGGSHTIPLAEAYSRDVVAPSLGNNNGATYAYPHPIAKERGEYLYQDGGNFYYADLVLSFLTSATEAGAFAYPVDDLVITSAYGTRIDPVTGDLDSHNGIDFAPRKGGMPPIYATKEGIVTEARFDFSYGNYVRIDHGGGVETLYAHLSELGVSVGDKVATGDPLGIMGTTGKSTGVHLHFEVWLEGVRVDPTPYLNQTEGATEL